VADRIRDRVRARARRDALAERAKAPARPSTLDYMQADERGRRLRLAAEELPPTQRLVILLVVWEGLSLRDVAEVTGLRYRTVKSNLNHARNALKRALEGEVSS
jgi:RNA polymerase sigma factor (sigma-70 family)